MLNFRRAVLLAAWFFAGFAPAFAADISGTWQAEFDTMIGVQKYRFEFRVEGETLTGRIVGTREGDTTEVTITEGRIHEQRVRFVELLNYQGMDLRISYEGELVSDDELKLNRRVGEFVTEPLVARRAK